jgi:DNA-binding NarL/FixJ family response regulator
MLEQDAFRALGVMARRAREGAEVAARLTRRERQVLELLSAGMTMGQIATRIGISPRTVETHVAKVYRKLGVRTRVQAVSRAATLGLVEL